MTFWITMILKTHMMPSYQTPAGATPILFHPKLVEAIFYNRMKLISIKGNDEHERPCWCASWTSISNKWIFVLEITMLHKE